MSNKETIVKKEIKNQKIPIFICILSIICIVFTAGFYLENSEKKNLVDVIQFDTIIELNAPKVGTNVLLFARYWVSSSFYSIAIRWGEPDMGALNFPTKPSGLIINSDDTKFSISSQAIKSHNQDFPKPIEDRGVFRHSFNAYPIDNIRFAEKEALASRIYTKDFANYSIIDNNDWQCFVTSNQEKKGIKSDVSEFKIKIKKDKITKLALADKQKSLIKGIDYEYSGQIDSYISYQSVYLPEKNIMVGFNGKGVVLKNNGQIYTYRELPGVYHEGGRKCLIDYKTIKKDNVVISIPSNIKVKRANNNDLLRTAKMSNYVQLKMNEEEVSQAAIDFGRLNELELQTHKLIEKYWLENRDNLENEDIVELDKFNKYFNENLSITTTLADKLKYLSFLIKIDLLNIKNFKISI